MAYLNQGKEDWEDAAHSPKDILFIIRHSQK